MAENPRSETPRIHDHRSDRTRNNGLLALVGILVALAVWTMVPADAPRLNDLGYRSACPFAPWSSVTLLLAAFLVWVIRQYFLTRPKLD
jgi:hypothetical protein